LQEADYRAWQAAGEADLHRAVCMEARSEGGRAMKIIGAHSILYSKDAEADRAFLKDVLEFPHVDVGHGWLIFGLPPSEIAVHPGEEGTAQEFYLMVDDVQAFIAEMKRHGCECAPVSEQRWGSLTSLSLPSGSKLGVYQPKHARPENPA
jgi:hypothetical protein